MVERDVLARVGVMTTRNRPARLRLKARGHQVTVYGRDQWVLRSIKRYRGMDIKRLPAPRSRRSWRR
jgi:hypothetical protein